MGYALLLLLLVVVVVVFVSRHRVIVECQALAAD